MSSPHRTRIKICGLTRAADVAAACSAGADALGFVLYERSKRYVHLQRLSELARHLPPFVTPVLLFVNAPEATIREALQRVPHAVLQFHGDETAAECEVWQRPFIRAARMAPAMDLVDWCTQFKSAQAILVDADSAAYGGSGKVFDWSRIPTHVPCPLVLSGGLTPANVAEGIASVRPWAVDVSSGVEQAPGIKDPRLITQFIQAAQSA